MEDPELLAEFVSESTELLADVSEQVIACEQAGDSDAQREILGAIFRTVHSIKGNSSFFGLDRIQSTAHKLENVLDDLRKGQRGFSTKLSSLILRGIDLLSSMVQNAVSGPGQQDPADLAGFLAELEETSHTDDSAPLQKAAETVRGHLPDIPEPARSSVEALLDAIAQKHPSTSSGAVPQESSDPTQAAGQTTPANANADGDKAVAAPATERRVMRIDEERIDAFLGYVGELVVIGDMFTHFLRRLEANDQHREFTHGLSQVTGTFQSLSGQLQSAIMSIRKVAARQLLRKVPKIVRDVAQVKNKQIQVVINGDDTEIDKGYLDLLDAPLVHMVRNAADHGIETPQQRLAAGKPEQGTITIGISEDAEWIQLTLQDDGAGIDSDRIAEKARDLGIIAPDERLDSHALIECIFAAGVSTAQEVSDISGRGVGMDVVKRSIENAGGKISVDTQRGVGTIFAISLPKSVTTQIGMGYFVRCQNELFILDLDSILETFHAQGKVTRTPSGVDIIDRRGQSLVVVDIARVLGLNPQQQASVAVSTAIKRRHYALLVDEVVGIKQMVKLPLVLPGEHNHPFQGVAMQGDGSLALILDLEHLLDA